MKIFIFGIVASGKTTLAKRLSLKLKIPYYEGDCITWGFPGEERYKHTEEEQKDIIDNIDSNGDWIIEGTYRESQSCLFDRAETVIFLDTPIYIRIYRIILRFIKQRLGMEKSHYKPTFDMLKMMFRWTYDFEKKRCWYEEMLVPYKHKLLRIKSEKELPDKFQQA